MRPTPEDTQSPQASASTNSATRASRVSADGVSQETGSASSGSAASEKFPGVTQATGIDDVAAGVSSRERRRGPSERHQRARPAGRPTKGFAHEMRARFDYSFKGRPPMPDAFEVLEECREVVLYEVVVSHDISPRTRAKYVELRDALAAQGWTLRLMQAASDGKFTWFDVETGEIDPEALREAVNKLDTWFKASAER